MLEHHRGIETAVPHFRGAVMAVLQIEVVLHALVAALGRSSGIVLQFPFLRIPGWDIDQPGVILHRKMNGPTILGI